MVHYLLKVKMRTRENFYT